MLINRHLKIVPNNDFFFTRLTDVCQNLQWPDGFKNTETIYLWPFLRNEGKCCLLVYCCFGVIMRFVDNKS